MKLNESTPAALKVEHSEREQGVVRVRDTANKSHRFLSPMPARTMARE
jgi:hypothetical protein